MTTPTVEANLGTVECRSYNPGHNLHWIPVLKKWANEPRHPMTIRHIESNKFEITSQGKTETAYNHTPSKVIRAINKTDPKHFKKVGNTGAITIDNEGGHAWLYFSHEPFIDCETPQPKYYDRYRFVDQEIARFEKALLTMTSEWEIHTINQFIEKAKLIKLLQQTNTHETMRTHSGYQTVCSCGLLLEGNRKIDEKFGHVFY